jgi:hypothetical protein
MDTFFEQIVTIRVTGKKFAGIILIWLAAIVLCAAILFASFILKALMMLFILLVAAILFGAYKLAQRFFVEYEYIITNGELDVDCIIARNSRKRLITIDLPDIDELGTFSEERFAGKSFEHKYICCNEDDKALYIIYNHPKQGKTLLVFAPNAKLQEAISKSVPRRVINL